MRRYGFGVSQFPLTDRRLRNGEQLAPRLAALECLSRLMNANDECACATSIARALRRVHAGWAACEPSERERNRKHRTVDSHFASAPLDAAIDGDKIAARNAPSRPLMDTKPKQALVSKTIESSRVLISSFSVFSNKFMRATIDEQRAKSQDVCNPKTLSFGCR